jgi:general secretion pathway protein E
MINYSFAKQYRVLVNNQKDPPRLAFSKQTPPWALHEAIRAVGFSVETECVDDEQIETLLARQYALKENSASIAETVEDSLDLSSLMEDIPAIEDLLESQDDAPIIRMINALLTEASRENASDIHFETFENYALIRFRIDGVLRDVLRPQRELHAAVISRIKIMAQMDIAEKRLPQDGRIGLRVAGRAIDVRVSTIPAAHGERAVLRLLEKSAQKLDLNALGMSDSIRDKIKYLVHQPHGIVLITGPTGSGKTTTLYAALREIDSLSTSILTVEDPIEYEIPNIGQIQVNSKIELTFARALRAILRQDPDVIMIGEIRDLETAQIAVQASLTGHLVLATLHTNDSVSAVTRLMDMGVEPFLLSSSLLAVLAQRLVRCLCENCKIYDASTGMWRAGGCPICNETGYIGRSGIHELLMVDGEMRQLVHTNVGEQTLREHAVAAGFMTMREDANRWLGTGKTTIEEVLRVTRDV